MAVVKYAGQTYIEAYITEILTEFKTWIDTDKNIAIKKVLFDNNSMLFFKNPNAVETDTPEYKIDLPVERFLDQTVTTIVPKFVWSEESYPGSTDPNLNDKPVFVFGVKEVGNGDDSTDTVAYSFLNMETIVKQYQTSTEPSTAIVLIDKETNTISSSVNISADSDNALLAGSDGGLYCPTVDMSALQTTITEQQAEIQSLQTLCQQLSERITALENK